MRPRTKDPIVVARLGLGHPVIYACSKKQWVKQKTHFDTNHMNTVVWDTADLGKAEDKLAAMIRATLPGEATLSDAPVV